MNSHDKNNLDFILYTDEKTLSEWYKTLSNDDLAYALELIHRAHQELADSLADRIDELYDDDIDVSYANQLLKRYQLCK